MTAIAECQKCGMLYKVEVKSTKEGFRETQCKYCGHKQFVYIKVITKQEPTVIGYAKWVE